MGFHTPNEEIVRSLSSPESMQALRGAALLLDRGLAAAASVPAYVVFSNATLEFFTRLKPKSVAEGLRIRGVGEVKAEKYLDAFLEVIREYEEAEGDG